MTRWILSADADRIQDFLFRSAHLREVVGGSQLLTRFCREAAYELLARQRHGRVDATDRVEQDVVVADGGSFTILCDAQDEAHEFGRKLAQLYHEVTGSTLTLGEPAAWNEGDSFERRNEEARQNLALAKQQGRPGVAVEHLPYAAFCASCGVGLAYTHARLHEHEEANYLCRACCNKAGEREASGFLHDFRGVVGEKASGREWVYEADLLADKWDPRNYVAYLVADANSMGRAFGGCTSPEQMRALSDRLSWVLKESLAGPTRLLADRSPNGKEEQMPVLPLILGGDDVFVLLPAPYALDFARRFCLEYERLMKVALRDEVKLDGVTPTMSAAVVVCKAKYPHTLAHRHGERLLEQAKRLTKTVARTSKAPPHSAVHFDVILGSRIAGEMPQATLRPYWATAAPPVKEGKAASPGDQAGTGTGELYPLCPSAPTPDGTGLPIDQVIQWRYDLKGLPKRRLAQMRTLFALGRLPTPETREHWQARFRQMVERIRGRNPAQAEHLDGLWAEKDEEGARFWYSIKRPGPAGGAFDGHWLPDLIEAWDFSYDLTRPLAEYRGQESER